jgi:DNA-binding transcriptional LysR family regulator
VTGTEATGSFRLAYVPGVTPGKWVRTWQERLPDVPLELIAVAAAEAEGLLRTGAVDAGLLRTPIDRSGLHAIALYTETTVVVVPKDHEVAGVDEVSVEDLADYVVLHPLDDRLEWASLPGRPAIERPATTADAIELVAAGVGLLLLPQSIARLHHRRDLTYRTMSDAPQSDVALSWPQEQTTDLMEEFIGIVRGRTANSSRGRAATPPAAAQPKQKQGQKREASGDARKKAASGKPAPRRSQGTKSAKPRRRS